MTAPIESFAVQKHLEIMQGVIQRMAENSRSCKVWCITLVSAVLVLVARTEEPQHALIALAPAVLLCLLDAFYLALERNFRRSYDQFVEKLHQEQAIPSNLYIVAPTGSTPKEAIRAMFNSFSVLPFYGVVVITVLLTWCWIL